MPTQLPREFLLYLAASALALGLDTAVFSLGLKLGLPLSIAAALGFSLGLMLNYTISTRIVFRQHRLNDRRNEFIGFALIGIAGLLLTEVLLWLLVQQVGLAPLAGKLAGAGAVFLFNFGLRKMLLFTARQPTLHTS